MYGNNSHYYGLPCVNGYQQMIKKTTYIVTKCWWVCCNWLISILLRQGSSSTLIVNVWFRNRCSNLRRDYRYTWFTRIFDPENFDSALQGGDQDGCPELLFAAEEAIVGGVLKEGTLAWDPRELLWLKGGGVAPVADKGVFSGVLGVVGLLVVVPLLVTQLVLDPGCTPEAVVVQITISGEFDVRCAFITSTLLLVNMMLCPTSRATTSVLERSRFSPSELNDSTIVGRSFGFHFWNKQKADQNIAFTKRQYHLSCHCYMYIPQKVCTWGKVTHSTWAYPCQ